MSMTFVYYFQHKIKMMATPYSFLQFAAFAMNYLMILSSR